MTDRVTPARDRQVRFRRTGHVRVLVAAHCRKVLVDRVAQGQQPQTRDTDQARLYHALGGHGPQLLRIQQVLSFNARPVEHLVERQFQGGKVD